MKLLNKTLLLIICTGLTGCLPSSGLVAPDEVKIVPGQAKSVIKSPPLEQLQIIPLKPANKYYFYLESQLLKNRGHLNKAITCLETAVGLEKMSDSKPVFLMEELLNLYIIRKDTLNALNLVEQLIKLQPRRIKLFLLAAKLKLTLKDWEGARDTYKNAIINDPHNHEPYLLLGGIYLDQNDLQKAIDVYQQLITQQPDFFGGYYFLAKAYIANSEALQAEKAYLKVMVLRPEMTEIYFELLDLYESDLYDPRRQKEKYEKLCLKILEQEPNNIVINIKLGLFYLENNRTLEGDTIFKELGLQSLSDSKVISTVAQLYISKKKPRAAVTILEAMLKGAPDSSDIRYAAGVACDSAGDKQGAIEHFLKVLPASGLFRNAVVHIAFMYNEAGDNQKAIAFLKDAVEKVPDEIEFMNYLGSFYEEEGDFKNALNIVKQGLVLDPENVKLNFRLGVINDKNGNKDASIASMQKVIQLDPENSNALNYLGYTYADLGINLDEAENLIRTALKFRPNDGYIIDSLGWVYYQKGQYEQAIIFLEKAVGLVDDDPILLEHLGDVYFKINDLPQAIEFYQRALENEPENPKVLKNKIWKIEMKN